MTCARCLFQIVLNGSALTCHNIRLDTKQDVVLCSRDAGPVNSLPFLDVFLRYPGHVLHHDVAGLCPVSKNRVPAEIPIKQKAS